MRYTGWPYFRTLYVINPFLTVPNVFSVGPMGFYLICRIMWWKPLKLSSYHAESGLNMQQSPFRNPKSVCKK